MNKRNNRILESLLILGLPLAIAAGCAADGNQLITSKPGEIPEQKLNEPGDAIERHVLHLDLDQLPFVEVSIPEAEDKPLVSDAEPALPPVSESSVALEADIGPIETEIQMITADAPLTKEDPSTVAQDNAIPEKQIFYFGLSSHQVDEVDFAALRAHAEFLIENPSLRMTVIGHTDSRGSKQYNATLSEKRAQAVVELLTTFGVAEGQLMTSSYGESLLLHDAVTEDENRRVELKYDDVILLSASE